MRFELYDSNRIKLIPMNELNTSTTPTIIITPIKEDGNIYISTKELFQFLCFSRHQKLKDKLHQLDIEVFQVNKKVPSIQIDDLPKLLSSIDGRATPTTLEKSKELMRHIDSLRKGNPYPISDLNFARNSNGINTQKSPKPKPISTKNDLKKNTNNTSTTENEPELLNIDNLKIDTKLEEIRKEVARNVEGLSVILMTIGYAIFIPIALILKGLSHSFRTNEFIFLVLLCGLYVQINHNATLFASVSEIESNSTKWFIAYLFGTVAELTALLLTIHSANRNTIRWFSIFTFMVNLLYYKIWEDFNYETIEGQIQLVINWSTLIVKIVQSGFLAFVIYSYSNLFTLDSVRNSE